MIRARLHGDRFKVPLACLNDDRVTGSTSAPGPQNDDRVTGSTSAPGPQQIRANHGDDRVTGSVSAPGPQQIWANHGQEATLTEKR
jgi:hypothetical protein